MTQLRTTILLLSVDEAPALEHSLPAALGQDGAEVVVLDNASSDATAELAASSGARLERLERRLSYAAAINEGLRRCGGEAVLLLNADCVLAPGFVAAAAPRLAEPAVGSVAPKLLRAAGPAPELSLGEVDAAGMTVDRRRKNGLVGHAAPAGAYAECGEVFGADGAAALYRRETLEQCAISGQVLDETLELWASDVDLAWRARLLGWRSVYEPRAVAHHVRTYSPSTRAQMSERDRRLQFRNRLAMIVANETAAGLRADWPRIAAYEVLALGHALLRERFLLGGYADAARLLPHALRKRRELQRRRRVERPPFGVEPAA